MKRAQSTPQDSSPSPALRKFLFLTAATTGGAIMIIEILGAKMLAPFLGTSHFVWTAQIAVTLLALSGGYYLGGLWADRSLGLARLYGAILAASVYLVTATLLVKPVAFAFMNFSLPTAALLTSIALFLVPLGLLAVTAPFVVRILTVSVQSVGGNVGRLTAISTLGSVVGTILIGYVLIPRLPNSVTMYLTALLLMLLAAAYFFMWGKKNPAKIAMLLIIALGALTGYLGLRGGHPQSGDAVELFHANSNFGMLQVLESKAAPRRALVNDYLLQGVLDTKSRQSILMFAYMLHGLARSYSTNISDVLCVGLGAGVVPTKFASEGAKVDVVEINPTIVPIVRDYFDFQPDKMNIVIADGREYLNRCAKRYDTIILDAFVGDSCPSHLLTRETFVTIEKLLKPGGALVINTFASIQPGKDFFGASLSKTLQGVFSNVRVYPSPVGNTFFVASRQPSTEAGIAMDYSDVHPACVEEVKSTLASVRQFSTADGIVLTDDYNPVEFYDAANREKLRRDMAEFMKSF